MHRLRQGCWTVSPLANGAGILTVALMSVIGRFKGNGRKKEIKQGEEREQEQTLRGRYLEA